MRRWLVFLLVLILAVSHTTGVRLGSQDITVTNPLPSGGDSNELLNVVRGVQSFAPSTQIVMEGWELPSRREPGDEWSVVLFVEPTRQASDERCVFHQGESDDERTPSLFVLPGTTRLSLHVSLANLNDAGFVSKRALKVGAPNHVSLVLKKKTASLFIDGELDSTRTFDNEIVFNSGPLYVGKAFDVPSIEGQMANFRVFGYALSMDQVLRDFQGGVRPPPRADPPEPEVALCEGQGTCGECLATDHCGWCASTATCHMRGEALNCTDFEYNVCGLDSLCRSLWTCLACVQSPGCGWCVETKTCVEHAKQETRCPRGPYDHGECIIGCREGCVHGLCEMGVCECDPGFSGVDCSMGVNHALHFSAAEDTYAVLGSLGTLGSSFKAGVTIDLWVEFGDDFNPNATQSGIKVTEKTGGQQSLAIEFNRGVTRHPKSYSTLFFLRDNSDFIAIDDGARFVGRALAYEITHEGTGNINLFDGNPHHIAWVIAQPHENVMEIFYDGVLQKPSGDTKTHNPSSFANFVEPVYLGASERGTLMTDFLSGTMDELRFWRRALTQAEIEEVKGRKTPASDARVLMYYPFDEGDGAMTYDVHGHNPARLVNFETSPFVEGLVRATE